MCPSIRHYARGANRVLVAVAVVAVVLGGGPGTAAADCTGGSNFHDDRYVDQRGDVVEVRIDHCGAGTRTVEIAGEDYSARVTIHDGTGNDAVTLLVDTYAPREGAFGVANPGDEFSIQNVDEGDEPLQTGEYDLRLLEYTSSGSTTNDDATMVVGNRSLDRVSVLAAPGEAMADLTTPAAVRAARANGTVANRTPFRDDVAVVALEGSGLGGALRVQDGPNETARWFELTDGDPLSLSVTEHASTVGAEQVPVTLPVGPDATTRLVSDRRNDTYYLLVDLDAALARERDDGDGREVRTDDAFVVNATVPADSPLASGARETATARFAVTDRSAAFAANEGPTPVYLLPGENLTVDGSTNVRPGRSVTLLVEEPGSVGSFTRHVPVTVGSDGQFSTTLDLRHRTDGTNLTLTARFRGETLAGETLDVRVDDPSASVRFDNQSLNGTRVVVANVSLSRPGFVAVHRGGPRREMLGVSRHLAAGSHANVTVPLNASALPAGSVRVAAVAYRDGDRDGAFAGPDGPDPAIERNRRAVNDRAVVEVVARSTPTPTPGTPTVTVTPTATPPGTPTSRPPTDTGTATATATTPTDGAGLPVPGFGAAAAVAAVLVALALVRRS